jgi:hypothetical protein
MSLLGKGFLALSSFLEKNAVLEKYYGTEMDSAIRWYGLVLQQKVKRQYFDGSSTKSSLCF